MTIMEAGAVELPVIATNHGGIPDVIQDKQNGFLIDENDPPKKIANLMIKLRNDPGLVQRLGNCARTNIIKNFSLKAHLSTITDALKMSI